MQFYGGITPDFCKYYAKHAHMPIPSIKLLPPPQKNKITPDESLISFHDYIYLIAPQCVTIGHSVLPPQVR